MMYEVKIQKPCGPRANPASYVRTVVVSAETKQQALLQVEAYKRRNGLASCASISIATVLDPDGVYVARA